MAKYKQYDASGNSINGIYGEIFEEEYQAILDSLQREIGDEDYMEYLLSIPAAATHQGYFSIDKNKKTGQERFVNSKLERGTTISADRDAYDLIMKNKERLLDRKEPVRFIFSHSALREGWDNTNIFQICTLKQSNSEVRKRQEVGRGLRLAVNQSGERMDTNVLGKDVHNINALTVIANESYDSFAKGLQSELAEAVADRPQLAANSNVKYDLIGKIVAETGLTRTAIVRILKGIEKTIFNQFKSNPEEFIIKAANLINEQKATVIIQHISYNKMDAVMIPQSLRNRP